MEMSLGSLYAELISRFEKFTQKKLWRVKLVLLLTFISLVLSTGAYFYVPTAMKDENWKSFNDKKDHPLTQLNYEPGSHAAKKTFRLTVPVIAKIFHLGNYPVFLLQFVASILFLFFSILLVEKITGDSITGLMSAIGLVFIYVGHAGFTDINTWFDEFAYLFLLLAMFTERWYLIFLFLQLACWTDERAIISSGFVFIWWKLKEEGIFNFKSLFNIRLNSSVTLLSVVFYFVTRIAISQTTGLHTPSSNVGLKVILSDTDFMGMAVWTSLEGYWLLIITAIIVLWKGRNFIPGFLIISLMAILILGAFSVFDKTRSSSYLFPIVFISLLILKNIFSISDLRKIILASAMVCFLFPSYYIISDVRPYILWYKPIFVRVIDFVRIHFYGH